MDAESKAPAAAVGRAGYRYHAYGLGVRSDVELPELIPSGAAPDVEFRLASLQRPMPTARGVEVVSADEAYLHVPQVGQFRIRQGRRIELDVLPGVDPRVVRIFLLGQALATLLHQRQLLVLHASAVVSPTGAILFLGGTGWGKSTTATLLRQAGYRLAADDLAALQAGHGAPTLLPSFPQVKLWPQTLQALGRDPSSLPKLHPDFEKRADRLRGEFQHDAAPVRRIYILHPADQCQVEPLPPSDALLDVLTHSYGFRLRLLQRYDGGLHLRQCSELVTNVPVRRLSHSARVEDLPSFLALLLNDLKDGANGA